MQEPGVGGSHQFRATQKSLSSLLGRDSNPLPQAHSGFKQPGKPHGQKCPRGVFYPSCLELHNRLPVPGLISKDLAVVNDNYDIAKERIMNPQTSGDRVVACRRAWRVE